MAEYIVKTENLNHHFSAGEKVLNDINLAVPKGSIYGFLGPNGAGKTTSLKLILGLLKKQQGSISIFGKEFQSNRIEILQNIGSLIEAPSLYGHLSARDNLKIWQKIYACAPERIDEVLRIVSLADTGKKKAGKFSLGMKQRLSIAIALLHEPELLILDEPTNGLDPNGILEIRELLTKINQEKGITIIISSHLLAEIEKMVNYVGIIHRGDIVFQGTLKELQIKQNQNSTVQLETNDLEKTETILNEIGVPYTRKEEAFVLASKDKNQVSEINKKLVNSDIEVYQLATIKDDLESIFMDITKS